MDYDKEMFLCYIRLIIEEFRKRRIKYNVNLFDELWNFCYQGINTALFIPYPEHNERYLKQCYFNLQEKYDREIISKDEFDKIHYLCVDEHAKELGII